MAVRDAVAVHPVHDRLRLALAGLWLLMAVLVAAGYERPARLADLYDAVVAGRVDSVVVEGGLPEGATGTASQQVSWHEDGRWPLWRTHRADLVVTSPGSYASVSSGVGRTSDDVAARVQQLDSGLQVVEREGAWRRSGVHLSWQLGGVEVTGVAGSLGALVFLGAVLLLVSGGEPWRATRWAWFWLCNPVTVIAYLLLSGPTPGPPAPRSGRRLTGGWSLLLLLVIGGPLGISGQRA